MSKKYRVFYVRSHMMSGDTWQKKCGTQAEVDEAFSCYWADEECTKITVEEKMEELKLTNPEHIL